MIELELFKEIVDTFNIDKEKYLTCPISNCDKEAYECRFCSMQDSVVKYRYPTAYLVKVETLMDILLTTGFSIRIEKEDNKYYIFANKQVETFIGEGDTLQVALLSALIPMKDYLKKEDVQKIFN